MSCILRDWTDSRSMDKLDVHSERFFARLLMKVDDFGRTENDSRLLKSRLFPLKTDIRESDISRWVACCHKAGLIRIYTDVKSRSILEIHKYGQRKKFMKSEYPPPEDQGQLPLETAKKNLSPAPEEEEKKKRRRSEILAPESISGEVKFKREIWKLLKDEETLKKRLSSEKESCKPDQKLIEALRAQLKTVRDEIKSFHAELPISKV